MTRVNGKVVIITGGARGMGASHVRKLAAEGAKVVFTDILEEEGKILEEELGENVRFIPHNVTDASEWEKVVAETEQLFGPVHVLVNNAGISYSELIENFPEEQFRRVIDVNQIAVFLGIKAVVPSMRKTANGSIINISSVSGLRGSAASAAYVSAKFAVTGITKVAALELIEYGIRVNSIHPGLVDTPLISSKKGNSKKILEETLRTIPAKRMARPEEVSNLVLYLASDESSYSTRSEFIVDGGITAR